MSGSSSEVSSPQAPEMEWASAEREDDMLCWKHNGKDAREGWVCISGRQPLPVNSKDSGWNTKACVCSHREGREGLDITAQHPPLRQKCIQRIF